MRYRRATLRGTAVPSTRSEAMMMSATYTIGTMRLLREMVEVFERTSFAASACSKLNAMHLANSPRRPESARSIASKRRLANLPS